MTATPEDRPSVAIGTNLGTVPSGEGLALTLLKAILPVFYSAMWMLSDDPAAAPSSAQAHR